MIYDLSSNIIYIGEYHYYVILLWKSLLCCTLTYDSFLLDWFLLLFDENFIFILCCHCSFNYVGIICIMGLLLVSIFLHCFGEKSRVKIPHVPAASNLVCVDAVFRELAYIFGVPNIDFVTYLKGYSDYISM